VNGRQRRTDNAVAFCLTHYWLRVASNAWYMADGGWAYDVGRRPPPHHLPHTQVGGRTGRCCHLYAPGRYLQHLNQSRLQVSTSLTTEFIVAQVRGGHEDDAIRSVQAALPHAGALPCLSCGTVNTKRRCPHHRLLPTIIPCCATLPWWRYRWHASQTPPSHVSIALAAKRQAAPPATYMV